MIQMKKSKLVLQNKGLAPGILLGFIISIIILVIVTVLHLTGNLDFLYQVGRASKDLGTVKLP